MADPFDWSPRNLGPSREERAAAAARRALPRRGYTYAASDGLTDRQRRQSYAAQQREYRRQQRARHRQTMDEARAEDRARRRARRETGDVENPDDYRTGWEKFNDQRLPWFEKSVAGLLILGVAMIVFVAVEENRGRR